MTHLWSGTGISSPAARRKVRRFLKNGRVQGRSVKDRLITYLLHSPGQYAIIPMQDILGLGREGHMNTPGNSGLPQLGVAYAGL